MSKKLCKDTEIKAFSHWHFEFLMARFWAVPVFSNEVWTVWSAYASADYSARPGRPNLPTQKPYWRWRNISLFTFLAGRTKEQVLDKGIRQKSTKRVGSIVVCSAFLSGVSQAWPTGLRENGMSAAKRTRHVLRFTVGKSFACIHVNQREVVKKKKWKQIWIWSESITLEHRERTQKELQLWHFKGTTFVAALIKLAAHAQ